MSTAKNAPCWCESGKKFKRCHYPQEKPGTTSKPSFKPKVSSLSLKPSFEEFMEMMGVPKSAVSEEVQNARLQKVLLDKKNGIIPEPSAKLIDLSKLLTNKKRAAILDIAAKYVDENPVGRNEMCQQFAMIVKYLLKQEGINSRIYEGEAKYSNGDLKHDWNHFWLVTENDELIDGNIDSLPQNPFPPDGLEPLNYWGPASEIPADRTFITKKEFTDTDEQILEKGDDETVIWKQKSLDEYNSIFS